MPTQSPRLLYLGTPLGALCLADRGLSPVAAALAPLDLPGRRRVRRRLRRTLLLGRPDLADPAVAHLLAATRPNALLSFFWPRRVPDPIRTLPPGGALGIHPSLLPRWRGPDPCFWALRAGDRETGVSLHRLAPDYDTGPVVARVRVPIEPDDDSGSLAHRLDRHALDLLLSAARRLADGEPLEGEPQDASEATDAPRPSPEDLAIDWRRPVDDILRLVRAAAPEPGATARIGDASVDVLRARRYDGEVPRALEPAEAVRTGVGLVVRAADGPVLLERGRDERGNPLRASDLASLC